MTRRLNSDALGKKGEQRFAELCVDAELVPNKADWDRTGWDYVVDWPAHKEAGLSLDRRPSPISCYAQVKTHWSGGDSIRVRLSSVERLAKDHRPSFIYVLTVSDTLDFVGASVIHVEGEFLELILRKLRECEKEAKKPNKVEFTFSISKWGEPISATGPAFRTFVEKCVGPSLFDYAGRKQKQLETLGFGSDRLHFSATITATTRDDIIDAFLGLKPVNADIHGGFEKRFGISLPIPDLPLGATVLEFQPRAFDECRIKLRRELLDEPIIFKGKMFGVPKEVAGPERVKFLLETDLFKLILCATGISEKQIDLSINLRMHREVIESRVLRAEDWRDFYSFVALLTEGPLRIEVVPKKTKTALAGTISATFDEESSAGWRELSKLASTLTRYFKIAGAPNTKLRISDVVEAWDAIDILRLIEDAPRTLNPPSFQTPLISDVREDSREHLLYIQVVPLGAFSLAYCVKVQLVPTLRDDGISWVGDEMSLVAIERFRSEGLDLNNFVERMKVATKVVSYVVSGGPKGALSPPEAA
ncbi:hypothetical protein [Caulobacter sp. 17J65-9]|uniref:hypothetical protein n=1 Tax=Caulobacter sp. 17J65-9 TaxID=2709382 RepID=UPI0013C5F4D5|nr:hypothetical protein [Caulobacter sp. 17J65-9]NEX91525.1 hypothetical protein [Caulobacter sp. 17J65-9]